MPRLLDRIIDCSRSVDVVRSGLRMLQDLDTRVVFRPLSWIGLRIVGEVLIVVASLKGVMYGCLILIGGIGLLSSLLVDI